MEGVLLALDEFKGLSEILLILNLILLSEFLRELRQFGKKLKKMEKSEQQPVKIQFPELSPSANQESPATPKNEKNRKENLSRKMDGSQSIASEGNAEKKVSQIQKSKVTISACPQCKAENSPFRSYCYRCNAKLLQE